VYILNILPPLSLRRRLQQFQQFLYRLSHIRLVVNCVTKIPIKITWSPPGCSWCCPRNVRKQESSARSDYFRVPTPASCWKQGCGGSLQDGSSPRQQACGTSRQSEAGPGLSSAAPGPAAAESESPSSASQPEKRCVPAEVSAPPFPAAGCSQSSIRLIELPPFLHIQGIQP